IYCILGVAHVLKAIGNGFVNDKIFTSDVQLYRLTPVCYPTNKVIDVGGTPVCNRDNVIFVRGKCLVSAPRLILGYRNRTTLVKLPYSLCQQFSAMFGALGFQLGIAHPIGYLNYSLSQYIARVHAFIHQMNGDACLLQGVAERPEQRYRATM